MCLLIVRRAGKCYLARLLPMDIEIYGDRSGTDEKHHKDEQQHDQQVEMPPNHIAALGWVDDMGNFCFEVGSHVAFQLVQVFGKMLF